MDYATGQATIFWHFPVYQVNRIYGHYSRGYINGRVLFKAVVSNNLHVLVGTDGTTEGTQALAIVPYTLMGVGGSPAEFLHTQHRAWYFNRGHFDAGGWSTDGTSAGTQRFAAPEEGVFNISNVTAWGENRYMIVAFGAHFFSGLWMLTEQGLKNCTPGGYGWGLQAQKFFPNWVRPGKRHIYYSAHGPGSGRELYRTDEHGRSSLVADLAPGVAWSDVTPLGQAGDWFYFIHQERDTPVLYRVRDDAPLPPAVLPQTPYEWLQTLVDVPRDYHYDTHLEPKAMTTGQDGSLYAAGIYSSPYGIASGNGFVASQPALEDVLTANRGEIPWDHYSFFLGKMNQTNGQVQWLMTLGDSRNLSSPVLLAPAPGNGVFFAATGMPGISPLRIGAQRFYLGGNPFWSRIDSAGQARWVLDADPQVTPSGISSDRSGHLTAVVRLMHDNLRLGDVHFKWGAGASSEQWGVARIAPDGKALWGKVIAPAAVKLGYRQFQGMATAPDNGIYLLFIRASDDFKLKQCDDAVAVQAEVWRLAPDGQVQWSRTLNPGGSIVPADIAVSAQGVVYMCGFAKGDVSFGRLTAKSSCDTWRDFVLTLNREGFPVSLRLHEDEEDTYAYSMAVDGKGHYAVAGIRGKRSQHIPYEGFAGKAPYASLEFREHFVRYHDARGQLLDEKRWQAYRDCGWGPPPLSAARIHIAPLDDNHFALMHWYGAALDTFAHAPNMWPIGTNTSNFAVALMRLRMQEAPPPPLVDDVPLRIDDVEIFPNPASHWITLRSTHAGFKDARLHLYNSLGQQVRLDDMPAHGPYRYLDVSHLPAGVYYLGIGQGEVREVKKAPIYR